MHRFLPALVRRAGGQVESVHVAHRPREHGQSHYGIRNLQFLWRDRKNSREGDE